ncbi:MAG: hypothetical protein MSD82_02230, partial [Prevotella sp.]|nr:hypothetical protein [Prevotella sp.]
AGEANMVTMHICREGYYRRIVTSTQAHNGSSLEDQRWCARGYQPLRSCRFCVAALTDRSYQKII